MTSETERPGEDPHPHPGLKGEHPQSASTKHECSIASANAIALRRYRARRRCGTKVVRVEVDDGITRKLFALQYLNNSEREDREAIARAIEQFLREKLKFQPSDLWRAG